MPQPGVPAGQPRSPCRMSAPWGRTHRQGPQGHTPLRAVSMDPSPRHTGPGDSGVIHSPSNTHSLNAYLEELLEVFYCRF